MEEKELFSPVAEVDEEKLTAYLAAKSNASMEDHSSPIKKKRTWPITPFILFGTMVFLAILADVLYPGEPGYMMLTEKTLAPSMEHLFGTDSMGRDVFGMVLHGGRISLLVGLISTLISMGMALLIGCGAAVLPKNLEKLITRFMDLFLSIPSILLMIFIQAMTGGDTLWSISLSIGLSSWMTMAKMVKTQVMRIKREEYVFLARYYGGGFFYLLKKHFLPTLIPIMFYMGFTGFGHAITAEATLSFLGIGFPIGTITWGTLLSLSGQALLTKAWWVIMIPGIFLVITVVSLVEIGDVIRKKNGIMKNL